MTTYIQKNIEKAQNAVPHSVFKKIVSSLVVSVSGLFVIYLYLVGALTFSVIEQKNVEQNLKKTTSAMGTVELSYLGQERGLTKEYAHSLGFVDYSQVAYTDMTHGLAINSN